MLARIMGMLSGLFACSFLYLADEHATASSSGNDDLTGGIYLPASCASCVMLISCLSLVYDHFRAYDVCMYLIRFSNGE